MNRVMKMVVISPTRAETRVRKALPASWKRAAGMLRHHKRGLDRYINRVRKEWEYQGLK